MNAKLKAAQGCLKIFDVKLREQKVLVDDDVYPETIEPDDYQRQSFKKVERVRVLELVSEDDEEKLWDYRFNYAVGTRLIEPKQDGSEDSNVLIEIVAVFEARYISEQLLSEEEVSAFSEHNVGYHVWPYWRELAQATCNKIALSPVIEVPLYVISKNSEEKSDSE